ncbi:heat shock protein Hsp70d-like protein [Leptotrombidium deliense]|uniref:Heat shock protein Hsp70d-like protein n=1 Tax=Leptotrombidium deliense TaxID=299467 RepID=A0A443S425_9ACAR|nr:heat shock protein Hsp70d-like protein [Leptotrombidium deliense]
MSQEEIEEKILVAELFKADDEKEKERLIARNNLEHNIFSIKNKLKSQFGSNLQQSDKDDAEAKIESTVLWLDANTSAPKERYEEKLQELTDLMKTLVLQQPSSSRN